jgi:prepilin-type N-terminal cleavage/methylation domain-containing protein
MKSYENKTGLSLVEMLIVVAIVVILTAMVIGLAGRIDNQSKEQLTRSTIALLESSLQEYHDYGGTFPVSLSVDANQNSEALYRELNFLTSSRKMLTRIDDSLIEDKVNTGVTPPEIYDSWGTVLDYRYVVGNTFPVLTSAGPDKKFWNTDDISSRK